MLLSHFGLLLCLFSQTSGFLLVDKNRQLVCSDALTYRTTQLFDQSEEQSGASVRFSGTDGLSTTITNPLDSFLSLLASDVASIALGIIGLLAVVIHRWALLDESAEALTVQTRTDLLATFACGSVLLNGITKLDVTAALAESVVLEGTQLETPEISQELEDQDTIQWGLESLLTATPAQTSILVKQSKDKGIWNIVARAGKVPVISSVPDTNTPILNRVGSLGNTKETYLPTLQALPGKREFPYLPSNTQLALLIPLESNMVLILGGNTAKSFTPRDVAWCRIVADRMGNP